MKHGEGVRSWQRPSHGLVPRSERGKPRVECRQAAEARHHLVALQQRALQDPFHQIVEAARRVTGKYPVASAVLRLNRDERRAGLEHRREVEGVPLTGTSLLLATPLTTVIIQLKHATTQPAQQLWMQRLQN